MPNPLARLSISSGRFIASLRAIKQEEMVQRNPPRCRLVVLQSVMARALKSEPNIFDGQSVNRLPKGDRLPVNHGAPWWSEIETRSALATPQVDICSGKKGRSALPPVGILCLQIAVAAEEEIPKFDIATACRASSSVQTPAQCMQDEQTAHNLLVKQWPQYKPADVSRCVQITTSQAASANYTELLTCLQGATIQRTDPFGPLPKLTR